MKLDDIINIALQALTAATKDKQEEAMKAIAIKLAEWVKSSETTIDDSLVNLVVVPNLDILVAEFKAAMAPTP